MKKKYFSLLAIGTLLVSFCINGLASPDVILSASDLIKKVEDIYSSQKTFKADFRQLYIGRNMGVIETKGEVYFKRPGMMKWLYKKGNKKIIASYGNNLWIYDSGDSQAIVDRNFKPEKLPSSLSFLWGDKRLSEVFNYKMLSFEEKNDSKKYIVELYPKDEIPNVSKIHFIIDAKDYLIIQTALFDFFGNENRLVFSNIKLGSEIAESFFKFELPKGVAVVESPKLTR